MRLTVFKLLLLLILIMPCRTYAYDVPKINGEDVFNDTASDIADGKMTLNPLKILGEMREALVKEIRGSGEYIITVLVIAAMSGVLRSMSDSFGGEGASRAELACFVLMSTAALRCFAMSLSYTSYVTDKLCDFITKLTPVLVTVLYACGSVTVGASFEPVLSAAVYIISLVIKNCLLPLICFSAVLSVAGNINDKVQISSFCRVLKSLSKWIMTAVITIFTAVSAVYGITAPSLDAVGTKAVKFAVGSMVPVVGNFLSDTLDTVLSGARLMKNAAGAAGMAAICAICLIPILKVFIIQLLLKAGAALCEPLADRRISAMLWEVSDSVMTLFAVTAMIMVLFLINIGIVLAATGF